LFPTGRRDVSSRRPQRSRPRLECLEDRAVPTVFTVNSTADILNPPAGTVTLRSAIQAANATPGNNTIDINVPGNYQITLSGTPGETDNAAGEFAITGTGNLTILNTSGGNVTVNAAGLNRVFDVNPAGATTPFTVTFQGLTITGGNATSAANPDGPDASGGGIRAQGGASIVLNNDVLSNNYATADGGGISLESPNNTSTGTLTLNATVISNNHGGDAGGGIETDGTGLVTINPGSVISGNTIVNQGAGIWLDNGGASLTITGAVITGNSAMSNTNGFGGGIGNAGAGTVTIVDSTVANNFAGTQGGGFGDQNNTGSLVVLDSTFVANTTQGVGGAIQEGGPSTTINDATITGNISLGAGGGLSITSPTFVLNNTIVAGNFSNDTGGMNFLGTAPDVKGAVTSGSGNFIGIGDAKLTGIADGDANHNHVGTAATPLNPDLGPLQNNGGGTPTEAPLKGSPVIAAGVNAVLPAGTTDQRGLPRLVNNTVDIGAVEVQPPLVTPPPPTTKTTTIAITGITDQYTFFTQNETVTARVTDSNGNPVTSGQVTFTDGGQTRTVAVNANGTASVTFAFSLFQPQVNAHAISALFGGIMGFGSSSVQATAASTLFNFLFELELDMLLFGF
jgi:CSLREA domain-containing protein